MARRFLLAPLLALFALSSSLGQDPDRKAFQQAKAATVFIRVTANGYLDKDGAQSSGTGFLYKKRNGDALVVTNDHVARPDSKMPKKVRVYFYPGTDKERECHAVVYGHHAEYDLATLLINERDLPDALSDAAQGEPAKDDTLYVHGFPLGDSLRTDRDTPAISVSTVKLTAVLQDTSKRAEMLQFDGNINPGNSGGPVVDRNGNLRGIAVAKIRDTQIGFAISPRKLAELSSPRLSGLRAYLITKDASQVSYEFKGELDDPLMSLTKLNLLTKVVAEDYQLPAKPPSGTWRVIEEGMTKTGVPVFRKALAVGIRLPAVQQKSQLVCQPLLHLSDGTEVAGDPILVPRTPWKSTYQEVTVPRTYKVAPERPLTQYEVFEEDLDGALAKRLVMPKLNGRSVFNRTLQSVYVTVGNSIQRIDANLAVVAELTLTGKSELMGISKSGVVIRLAAGPLLVLDAASLKVQRMIDVLDVDQVAVSPALTIGFAPSKSGEVQVIDFDKGAVVDRFTVGDCIDPKVPLRAHVLARGLTLHFPRLKLTEDGKFAYCADWCIMRLRVEGTRLVFDEIGPLLGDRITPDFGPDADLLCPTGVYHPGSTHAADLGRGNATYLFSSTDLRFPVLCISDKSAPEDMVSEPERREIWFKNGRGLDVYSYNGIKLAAVDGKKRIRTFYVLREAHQCIVDTESGLVRLDLGNLLTPMESKP